MPCPYQSLYLYYSLPSALADGQVFIEFLLNLRGYIIHYSSSLHYFSITHYHHSIIIYELSIAFHHLSIIFYHHSIVLYYYSINFSHFILDIYYHSSIMNNITTILLNFNANI